MSSQNPSTDPENLSASERFRAAQLRQAEAKTPLGVFARQLGFELDEFQRKACQYIQDGHGVLVAAPTGAGKTVPGEFAIHMALMNGQKAFYTTPIKALSNQKYTDLVATYGPEKIGLLTGDTSRNPEADVVVMTTEVLRNMLYADSDTLTGLAYVVMDEVHYLADRFRGAVWEEVIIHLPEHVQIVALSATVSNAEEFGAWLNTVRGDTSVVVSEHRPVPLWQHVMAGKRLYDLFSAGSSGDRVKVNPELAELVERQRREAQPSDWGRHSGRRKRGPQHRGRGRRWDKGPREFEHPRHRRHQPHKAQDLRTSRPAMIRELERNGLLPMIGFIFSRAGCEAAVEQCLSAGLDLTTKQQKREIELIVNRAGETLPDEDREVLGFWGFRDGLRRGFAAHHAGMLPAFKEVVEELFAAGLIKVVFATETLALGINMPARTVVLDKLVKFNGEAHVDITPGEYTQLTGRAGRRGIDIEGHAVVMWQPRLDPAAVAGLASRRTYPLNSSFKPTYNMSVNLLSQYGRDRTRGILESSFAQFQADRSVVGLAQELKSMQRSLSGYEEAMSCHLGDFTEYARIRRELSDAEKSSSRARQRAKRRSIMDSLNQLIPGDIFTIKARGLGDVVVVSPAGNPTNPRVGVVTPKGQLRRVGVDDVKDPIVPEYGVNLPKKLRIKTPTERKNIASWMREAIRDHRKPLKPERQPAAFRLKDEDALHRVHQLRQQLHSHPCHGCAEREDHWRWATRWNKLHADAEKISGKISGRTNTIARTFDRISTLLEQFGYVEGDHVTDRGQSLRRIYGDRDLLTAMLLEHDIVNRMNPEDLAGLAALLVFEAPSEEMVFQPNMPTENLQEALDLTDELWYSLQSAESKARLNITPQPNPGLVWPIMRWVRGNALIQSLKGSDLAAGDFVRWARQVIDVLDQLSKLDMHPDLARRCYRAKDLVNRGIVAYSSEVHTPESQVTETTAEVVASHEDAQFATAVSPDEKGPN